MFLHLEFEYQHFITSIPYASLSSEAQLYVENCPPVIWTGKTCCRGVEMSQDGGGWVKKYGAR